MVRIPLSILDLAAIGRGETARDALDHSVALAQQAEARGYLRVWYAEHHNMATIASSATSVVIAHVAAHTSTIRLGAGGVMLPNHAPLVIAEHYGTLATLHPGRIDLALGRAPGSDQRTQRALRRDPRAADAFPQDVLELQAYLAGRSRVTGPASRSTSSARHCSAPSWLRSWACRSRSRPTSPPTCSRRPSPCTARSSDRRPNGSSPTSWPG
jgi:luciferase family oxidoreductase group 1